MTEQKLKEIQNLIEYYQRTNSDLFEQDIYPPLVVEIISDINNILKSNQHQEKPWRKIAEAMHKNMMASPHRPAALTSDPRCENCKVKSAGRSIDAIYNLLYNAYKAGKKVEEELPPRS
jgi:hypothetical protein